MAVVVRRGRIRGSYQARSWVSHFVSCPGLLKVAVLTSLLRLFDGNRRALSDLAMHWDGSQTCDTGEMASDSEHGREGDEVSQQCPGGETGDVPGAL